MKYNSKLWAKIINLLEENTRENYGLGLDKGFWNMTSNCIKEKFDKLNLIKN